MINLSVSNYLQLLNNKQGMIRLNLVYLVLLFILNMQCLQLQRHQEVQHDQMQVLVGMGGIVGSAIVTDKLKIVYFLLLMFLAIMILYLTITIIVKQFWESSTQNERLSNLMKLQGKDKDGIQLKFISAHLEVVKNQNNKKMKFPIIDRVKAQTIKITKKIEVMQWRQAIDFMELFKKNQITFYGLLKKITTLEWVDRNEAIKGEKKNHSNNWKLKSESFYNTLYFQDSNGQTKILSKQLVQKLFCNYTQVEIYELQIKEQQKKIIRYNIINEINNYYKELLQIVMIEQIKLQNRISKSRCMANNPQNKYQIVPEQVNQYKILKNELDLAKGESKQLKKQIMKEIIKQRSINFDEKFIYLLSGQDGQNQNHGSLRISFQSIKLLTDKFYNFVLIQQNENNKNNKKNEQNEIYKKFDVIIGQKKLTKEEYFHQLYWRKNSGRILIFIQMGVIFTLGVIIGIFAFKVVVEDNPLLDSLCRSHNLLMGFIFIYSTVWLILAITEVNFMVYCYWNLISKKQIFLFFLSIAISSLIIILLIKSKQSHDIWKELNTVLNAQS